MRTNIVGETTGESIVSFSMRSGVGEAVVAGDALQDREVPVIMRQLVDMAKRSDGRLVLDATSLRPFSCTWINALIELDQRCRAMGGQLAISGLGCEASDLIRSTGLEKRLRLVVSRADGIKILRQGQARSTLFDRLFGREQAA
jgi:anti-anti-sigma factor